MYVYLYKNWKGGLCKNSKNSSVHYVNLPFQNKTKGKEKNTFLYFHFLRFNLHKTTAKILFYRSFPPTYKKTSHF